MLPKKKANNKHKMLQKAMLCVACLCNNIYNVSMHTINVMDAY